MLSQDDTALGSLASLGLDRSARAAAGITRRPGVALDGFPTDDSASNQLAFAMLVCTSTELLKGIEIEEVLVLLRRDDQATAVNAPVSDGEPPADGEAVRCSNYLTYIQDSQLPLKS